MQAVGLVGKSASSYRIVVGGMCGMVNEDLAKIGPKKSDHPRCKESISADNSQRKTEEMLSNSQIAIQESLALLPVVDSDEKAVSVVFCGVQSEGECEGLEALLENSDGYYCSEQTIHFMEERRRNFEVLIHDIFNVGERLDGLPSPTFSANSQPHKYDFEHAIQWLHSKRSKIESNILVSKNNALDGLPYFI